ncbi:TauD/TfdA family dioxygenase [Hyalangium versicolor]|uniref:TauD/TfdA family dioxygenase n=1 Tax=Hyalangium versicolor TaxID=2861190 RepID=UPI001CCA29BD|nr:TauD/TfdA family dioxygenase [Hyalangium versicolor]
MKASLSKLRSIKPRAVSGEDALVRYSFLGEAEGLPIVVSPEQEGVVLEQWIGSNLELLDEKLLRHGGILFRGFGVNTPEQFHQVVGAFRGQLLDYMERSSPRSRVTDKVYTSTEHPADQRILFHNELAYSNRWPRALFFGCIRASPVGGETPIGDSREVLRRLSPGTRRRFEELGVMYVRYLGGGLGLHWRDVFQTERREDVERYCEQNGLTLEWDGDRVRTRSVRPAIRKHPRTGEEVWFNHGYFFNLHSIPPALRENIFASVSQHELPFNTFFGDGSEIPEEMIREISEVHDAVGVTFPWKQGDVLYIDNMLTAHSRNPFQGDRTILVSMSDLLVG